MANNNWHPEAPEQQSRLARLCLAQLENDGLIAESVYAELLDDPRGHPTATHALLYTFVLALVELWSEATGDPARVAAALRAGLLDLEQTAPDGTER